MSKRTRTPKVQKWIIEGGAWSWCLSKNAKRDIQII